MEFSFGPAENPDSVASLATEALFLSVDIVVIVALASLKRPFNAILDR